MDIKGKLKRYSEENKPFLLRVTTVSGEQKTYEVLSEPNPQNEILVRESYADKDVDELDLDCVELKRDVTEENWKRWVNSKK
jgi:hypothetical protein